MNLIKVASNSKTSSVAGAIAHTVRESGRAEVQAIGASAINQTIKALIMARQFLAEEGTVIVFVPEFVTVAIQDKERTAVRFSVFNRNGPALTPLREESITDLNVRPPLEEETALDHVALMNDVDEIRDQAGSYTLDDDIADDFEQRQTLAYAGRMALLDKLDEHNAESPTLSGGDVDAAWDQAVDAGEETVGGSSPTPDQDNVDELGEAVGLTYEDGEPLRSGEKLEARDRHRWELDPASANQNAPTSA